MKLGQQAQAWLGRFVGNTRQDRPAARRYAFGEDPDAAIGPVQAQQSTSSAMARQPAKPGNAEDPTRAPFDLRNTVQVAVGAVLVPLGAAVVMLGWYGAAHARVDQQQIPYILSGGFLGLGLIVTGCFFFWAHWLYRVYDQADLQHKELMESQAELKQELAAMRSERQSALGANELSTYPYEQSHHRLDPENRSVLADETPRVSGSDARRPRFLATATGSNFHALDCPIVAGRAEGLRSVSEDEAARMMPCRICGPTFAHGDTGR